MTPARERLTAVLVVLGLGGGTVLVSTQRFASVVVQGRTLAVAGSTVAPVLAPLGLVAMALAAALTIAGRTARVVLAVVLVLLGTGVIGAALPAALDPAAGARSAVSTATGVAGAAALRALTAYAAGTGWPWAGVADGLLLAAAGVAVAVRSRRWPIGARRYRAVGESPRPASTDPVEEWDALTAGADPTEPD